MKRLLILFLALVTMTALPGQPGMLLVGDAAAPPPAQLLLDQYPGAAAAYSLRLLRAGYTGPCIEVRRQSDNAPSNIGFSGGVLDTISLKTFCAATNCFLTNWYDQSVNNRNITQTTTTAQPTIVVNGVVQRAGGEPCANFDGSSDWLTISFALGQTQTRLAVLQHNSAQNDNHIIFDDGDANDRSYLLFSSFNTLRLFTTGLNLNISPVLNSTPFVSTGIYAAGATQIAVNNLTPKTGSSTAVNYSGITIASRKTTPQFLSNINLQEVVIYPSNKSSDIAGMHANANNFYSLY
jgi:hypothetical protein